MSIVKTEHILLEVFLTSTCFATAQEHATKLEWDEVAGLPNASVLRLGAGIESIAWSPDEKLIAIQTRSTDDQKRRHWSVQLHAADTGRLVTGITDTPEERLRIATKTQEPKFSVRFSPDGRSVMCVVWAETYPDELAKGSAKKRHWSEIRRWDTATGKETQRFIGAEQEGLGLAFQSDLLRCEYSPDRRLIAGGGKLVGDYPIAGSHIGGEVSIWDAESGKLKWYDRSTHTDIVYSLAFSPDGKTLASGGLDKLIRLWDADTGKLLRTLYGVGWEEILSLQFSRDGATIASGGSGRAEAGRIRIWNTGTGELINTLSGTGNNCHLDFMPNGDLILTTQIENAQEPTWKVRRWDTHGQVASDVFTEQAGHIQALCLSPNGKAFLLATTEGNVYRYKFPE